MAGRSVAFCTDKWKFESSRIHVYKKFWRIYVVDLNELTEIDFDKSFRHDVAFEWIKRLE